MNLDDFRHFFAYKDPRGASTKAVIAARPPATQVRTACVSGWPFPPAGAGGSD